MFFPNILNATCGAGSLSTPLSQVQSTFLSSGGGGEEWVVIEPTPAGAERGIDGLNVLLGHGR